MSYLQVLVLAVTIFATTADDLLWLIPYVASSRVTPFQKSVHMLTFVLTLQLVCLACGLIAYCTTLSVVDETAVAWIGAGVAWFIALFLYVKKWLKRRRRSAARALQEQTQKVEGENRLLSVTYGSTVVGSPERSKEEEEEHIGMRPWDVLSFTLLGALDEISYFPAILLSNTFTIVQLNIAALIASVGVLCIIQFLLVAFTPVLEWMDKNIPLYGVVALFAILLTVEAVIQD